MTGSTRICGGSAALCDIDDWWIRRYGEDTLVGLLIDSSRLHVYWDTSTATRMQAETHCHTEWSRIPKVLRVYNVTNLWFNGTNAPACQEIYVHDAADNWYVHGLHPGCDWVVDLGIFTPNQSFVSLNRSNVIRTPFSKDGQGVGGCMFQPPLEVDPEWKKQFTGYSLELDVQAV